jgi:alkylhydroperoxidase family enzyme
VPETVPWIEQVPHQEAEGVLREELDAAVERAGRVWHIVHVMSLNPEALRDSIRFYQIIMFGDSPLSRIQREMLATVVSAELECHY